MVYLHIPAQLAYCKLDYSSHSVPREDTKEDKSDEPVFYLKRNSRRIGNYDLPAPTNLNPGSEKDEPIPITACMLISRR